MTMRSMAATFLIVAALPLTTAAAEAPAKKWENKLIGTPLASYSPETGWTGILTGAYLFKTGTRGADTPASSLEFISEYSVKNQSRVKAEAHLYGEGYSWYANIYGEYRKFPGKFFGTGPFVTARDAEPYTPESIRLKALFLYAVAPSILAGAGFRYEKFNMLAQQAGGLLEAGNYAGSQGSVISGFSLAGRWDTRDSVQFARSGHYYQLALEVFPEWTGTTRALSQVSADLRNYFPLFDDRNSISMQFFAVLSFGDAPVESMPRLGGNAILRGLFSGMYRDDNMMVLQSEYKWLAFDWMSVNVFGGIGSVAPDVSAFSAAGLKCSFGGGLHFIVDSASKMTLRLDAGYGSGSSGVYLTTLEAF